MSEIKIAVACHKPSELPKSDIYFPVQVGAAIAKKKLNLPGDNTGENISEKNETYCELTAQYWAWKNLKADYYGLCHYRRFLYLRDDVLPDENERRQVEVNVLNDYSQEKYGISDNEGSKKFIEKYDVVVGMEQDVDKLYTPAGHQPTAWRHWMAHDRYLISSKDVKCMLAILKKKYPEIGEATIRYLKGNHFLGFNCFVMKKKFFDEMCSMEFDVLETLEKYVDRSKYHQQMNRIYGFMGEILFSGYVAYLREKKLANIKNVQLIYFNETDPVEQFYPEPVEIKTKASEKTGDNNTIPVVYCQGNNITAAMLTVCLKGLFDSFNDNNSYDVLVIHNKQFSSYYKNKVTKLLGERKNISLRFLREEYYKAEQKDRNIRNVSIDLEIPWILKHYKKAVVLGDGILVNGDTADLYNMEIPDNKIFLASRDLLNISKVNEGAISFSKHLTEEIGIKDPYSYFSTDICVIDLERLRKAVSEAEFVRKIDEIEAKSKSEVYKDDIYNYYFGDRVELISDSWRFIPNTSDYTAYILPQMPYVIYKEYQKITQDNALGIKIYPLEISGKQGMENTLVELLFAAAKEAGVYEILLKEISSGEFVPRVSNKLDTFFPANSWQTSLAYKVFPIGTPRYERMRKILVKNKLIR